MPTALRLVDLTYTYDPEERPLEALVDINLEVEEGEFVAVVGPSGCGKTTLLRLIAGLEKPSDGRVEIERNGNIGFVFQNGALMPWRTVVENITLPLEVKGRKNGLVKERAGDLVELVGLQGFESAYPRELSGGMQQRVALARALANDPAVLLLDEPFGALDALSRERMNEELQRIWLASGKTVLMVTHSIDEAVFLADRVVVLSQRPGRVRGVLAVAFDRPRTQAVKYEPEFVRLAMRIRSMIGLQEP